MAIYVPNEEAAQIAADLIPKYHPRLAGLKIAHLLNVKVPKKVSKKSKKPVKQPRQGSKVTIAKCSKVTTKTQALAEQDIHFVIEYDSLIWDAMPVEKRTAVVDHELCHCGSDADGVYLIKHTLEDFKEILQRHGFWKADVEDFARTVLQVAAQRANHTEASA